jgi:two-component sensor histidine kinase
MAAEPDGPERIDTIRNTPDLAHALGSDRFRQFLDHVPVAIAVSELPADRIAYANIEFGRLVALPMDAIEGRTWNEILRPTAEESGKSLNDVMVQHDDQEGSFILHLYESEIVLDAWANVIVGDDGAPIFRLVALSEIRQREKALELEKRIEATDILLRELHHRVKNNLQMITALIRLESRNIPDNATSERIDRLAGRVEALGLLYRLLSNESSGNSIDLGIYLSQIASAVMQAHAVEGIRLDLKVDTWPVSIDVAMPTGLIVNEVLTNSLKHAFSRREGGIIKLHSLVDDYGCRVLLADDGNGLAEGDVWPHRGKLGELIVRSLTQNAKAKVSVQSTPGQGVQVTIFFARSNATPDS